MPRLGSKVKSLLKDKDEKFVCDVCSEVHSSKSSLRTHMYRHYSDGMYTCHQCPGRPVVFHHSKLYDRHKKSFHSAVKPYKCEHCPAKYNVKSRLDAHMVLHSDARPFPCTRCDKRFKRNHSLRSHMKIVHTSGPRSCRPFLKCDLCAKEFLCKNNLRRHLYLHFPDGQYVCDVCDKVFEHGELFKVHKKICMQPSAVKLVNNRYNCHWCDKNFLTKFRLESHIVVHSPDRNFPCTQCPKRFKRKRHLRLHTINVHEPKENKKPRTQLEKCVELDEMVHHPDKELSCAPCNKIFQDVKSLRMHFVIFHDPHNPNRNAGKRYWGKQFYECAHCDAVYKHKCRLRDHMVRHSTVRNVKCDYCEKLFKHKSHLRKHHLDYHLEKQQKIVHLIMCDEKLEQIVRQEVRIFRVHETVDAFTSELESLIA